MTDTAETSVDTLRRRARRRLLGAVVLALGAAIALPLVFEKEPPPLPDEVDIRVPPVDKTPFTPKPTMSKGDAPVASVTPAAPRAIESAKVAPSAPAPVPPGPIPSVPSADTKPPPAAEKKAEPKPAEPKLEQKDEPKAVSANADPDGPKTEPKSGDFAVQLVAVRDADNAQKVLERARSLGYKTAYREKIDVTGGGVVTRVRTGPYKDKATAERISGKLKAEGFEAVVIAIK
jgi:DedD protein